MAENVSALIESFNQLDCVVEFNKVSMYNEVLFFNYIHRFRQTNLMYGNSWSKFSESDILPSFVEEQRFPKITELGAENPRVSMHSVSSTGKQPSTKRARIDNQQFQVTATSPTHHPPTRYQQQPVPRTQYNAQRETEYINSSMNSHAQLPPITQPSNIASVPSQQQTYVANIEQQPRNQFTATTSRANNTCLSVDLTQMPDYEQSNPRGYAEQRFTVNNMSKSRLQQSQAELKYSPSININVTFNDAPQPRYQLTPDYYQQHSNAYAPQNNSQQQSYYANYEHEYYGQMYYPQQPQPGQPHVNNENNNSDEYTNYR